MTQVGHLASFTKNSNIAQFFGKTYEDAVASANKAGKYDFYYEQEFGKNKPRQAKSILVCWGGGKQNED